MSLNLLITGGAGFIGSHTIVEFLNAGHSVICVDNCCNVYKSEKDEQPESLKRVEEITGKKIKSFLFNLCDKKALDLVFKENKINQVIHFAALKDVGESCKIPLEYYQNNITSTCVLLETMAENGVYNLVFSSSSTVYGDAKIYPTPEDQPTGNCTNPYGKTKFMCEEIMKDVSKSEKRWKIFSLRYFNPIGAHESGKIGENPKSVPKNLLPFISQVAVGKLKILKIFGDDYETRDGTAIRDYCHVVDIAKGHVAASEKLESNDDFNGFAPFNLGNGYGFTVLEVLEAFSKACGKKVPYEIAARRAGDVAQTIADPKKAEREFGWKIEKGLKEMCEDAWRWQKNNPNGFEKF